MPLMVSCNTYFHSLHGQQDCGLASLSALTVQRVRQFSMATVHIICFVAHHMLCCLLSVHAASRRITEGQQPAKLPV